LQKTAKRPPHPSAATGGFRQMEYSMKVTESEMHEALQRSGYILESVTAKNLAEWGFFVQTGQVVEDPITGKGRDIDIIANSISNHNHYSDIRTISQIEYVFEVKNNLYPIVLLTEFRDSPYIESWTGLKERITEPLDVKGYESHEAYFETLVSDNNNIYTQYCSFHKKRANDELMASHPEKFHESISKIIQHCDEAADFIEKYEETDDEQSREEKIFRHFLYMPVLLVRGDLYELQGDNLKEVKSSTLVVNYYHKGEQRMAFVLIVTSDGFEEFIKDTQLLERTAAKRMAAVRQSIA
jgi:hypothetical protein